MTRDAIRFAAVAVVGTAAALVVAVVVHAQTPKTLHDGVFTGEQALRGKSGYDGVCARCHGIPLTGSQGNGPTLKGPAFLGHWDKDTVGGLYTKIRDTMPLGVAGTLTDEVKLQILAYLLEQNGFPAGKTELPAEVSALDEISIQQRGVWDGVFSEAQADRGRLPAARCQGCHGPQFAGTDRAPALKGAAFLANWEGASVSRLFAKVRDTMPPGNTDSIGPDAKVDILAFLFRENGFPSGPAELTANTELLDGLQIAKKDAGGGTPNFSLVQIVGCFSRDPSGGWTLTQATAPVVTRDSVPGADALESAESRSLGGQTYGLVSVDASAKTGALDGRKVEVRGLLYRDGAYGDINLTSLRPLGPDCVK